MSADDCSDDCHSEIPKETHRDIFLKTRPKRKLKTRITVSLSKIWNRLEDFYEELQQRNKEHPDNERELILVIEYLK
jgi:hypothetical protein